MLAAILSATNMAMAEKPSFEYSVGAELTSAYLWRGFNYGGISLQPCAEISYAGFTLGAWGNIGVSDWQFNTESYFSPELDVYLSYSVGGFTASITHLHYFDGSNYFDFSNSNTSEGDGNTNQTEAMLSYTISDGVPLTIAWYTQLWGTDGYYANGDSANLKRAYSSYIELSYDFSLPWDINMKAIAGFSPWRSLYSHYQSNFAFNNISVRLEREFEIGDVCTLSAFAQPMFNLYDAKNFAYNTNFMWAVGMGIWF